MVLFPEDNDLKLLNTQEEKISLLEKAGVDNLIIIPFTKEFSRLSSVEFVRDIIVNALGTKNLVIGYDHHFGRNREGSFEHLKEYGPLYGFEVEEIPKQLIDDVAVSSTKVRNCLLEGDIKDANTYLGYRYFFTGTVVPGNQLGRTLGYPTANIEINDRYKLVPANGI
jgi:riboflavin kinase / FMN adenylyltransferase